MRVATAIVSPAGFQQVEANEHRERWARDALDHLAALLPSATLLVLPAGFLAAPSATHVADVASALIADAAARKIDVVVGVDVVERAGKKGGLRNPKASTATPAHGVPLHPFAAVSRAWSGEPLWQRSITGAEGQALSPTEAEKARRLSVGGRVVEVLLCGEVFAPAIRDAVLRRAPRVVAVLAHTAQGSRHGRGITQLAHANGGGITVVRAVHAVSDARTSWACSVERGRRWRAKVSDAIWLDGFDFPTDAEQQGFT